MAGLGSLSGGVVRLAEAEVYRACTGRSGLPDRPFREAWLICGRRSGKSFTMALIAVYLGCFRDYRLYLGPGEKATVMVIAADKKQAKQVLRFMRGLLSAPVLAKRVVNDTAESIEIEGDVTLEVVTASHAVRGYSVAAALVDELAFFPSDDASVSGSEIIAAIRPAMLTIPRLIVDLRQLAVRKERTAVGRLQALPWQGRRACLGLAGADVGDESERSFAGDRRGV
jgi:hypothetical protein